MTRLLAGEEAHRKTYLKIFAFLRGENKTRTTAKMLMEAYLRDVARDIGMQDEYDQAELTISTRKEKAVAHLFRGIPDIIFATFYALGAVAKNNDIIFNGLMTLAETAVSLDRQSTAGFPENFFSTGLRKPPTSHHMLGGSLGDLFSKIYFSDAE